MTAKASTGYRCVIHICRYPAIWRMTIITGIAHSIYGYVCLTDSRTTIMTAKTGSWSYEPWLKRSWQAPTLFVVWQSSQVLPLEIWVAWLTNSRCIVMTAKTSTGYRWMIHICRYPAIWRMTIITGIAHSIYGYVCLTDSRTTIMTAKTGSWSYEPWLKRSWQAPTLFVVWQSSQVLPLDNMSSLTYQ